MSKSSAITTEEKTSLFSVRFLISLLLIVAGIAWLVFYYTQARGNPLAFPPVEGSPKAVADLGRWNYAIGFGLLMLGLMVSAHPSTPLGRGRGVVIGMLGCFLIGLVWIVLFYFVGQDDSVHIPVMDQLQQSNLLVGVGFMAVGFTFATKWE